MYFPEATQQNILIASSVFIVGTILIFRELSPATQMGYSKFTKQTKSNIKVSSKTGMLIIYVPSLLLCCLGLIWSLSKPPHVKYTALFSCVHFMKRVYEVLCVHHYSGQSMLKDNVTISFSYSSFSFTQLYFTALVPASYVNQHELALGAFLFLVGEGVNHYHHLILADLRKDGSKEYKIPQAGLFEYIWCPHYLGEMISFIAMTLLSQHMMILLFQLSSIGYLTVRAYNTKLWYKQKFDKVPEKACLVPGIF